MVATSHSGRGSPPVQQRGRPHAPPPSASRHHPRRARDRRRRRARSLGPCCGPGHLRAARRPRRVRRRRAPRGRHHRARGDPPGVGLAAHGRDERGRAQPGGDSGDRVLDVEPLGGGDGAGVRAHRGRPGRRTGGRGDDVAVRPAADRQPPLGASGLERRGQRQGLVAHRAHPRRRGHPGGHRLSHVERTWVQDGDNAPAGATATGDSRVAGSILEDVDLPEGETPAGAGWTRGAFTPTAPAVTDEIWLPVDQAAPAGYVATGATRAGAPAVEQPAGTSAAAPAGAGWSPVPGSEVTVVDSAAHDRVDVPAWTEQVLVTPEVPATEACGEEEPEPAGGGAGRAARGPRHRPGRRRGRRRGRWRGGRGGGRRPQRRGGGRRSQREPARGDARRRRAPRDRRGRGPVARRPGCGVRGRRDRTGPRASYPHPLASLP
ncbi:hypothetical protein [Nocardioides convexus]|uniref:hypothetical protein n=1 Tax=Nocardioides convexus TaxID=2712224 RepID=UPI002418644C|nr:hypothetical protein [Nocardioides convexus]